MRCLRLSWSRLLSGLAIVTVVGAAAHGHAQTTGTCVPALALAGGIDPALLGAAPLCDADGSQPIVPGVGHPDRVNGRVVIDVTSARYGAIPNDNRDDTLAIQAAIDALPSRGGVLLLPAGTFRISRTLHIDKPGPVHVLGVGANLAAWGSILQWDGTSGPALLLIGLQHSRFEDFGIHAPAGTVLEAGIQVEGVAGRPTRELSFIGLAVTANTRELEDGFRFRPGTYAAGWGTERNNQRHYFERVHVSNYHGTGFRFEDSSSGGHLFVSCNFVCTGYDANGRPRDRTRDLTAAPIGLAGISTERGGSFHWLAGTGMNCGVGFDLGPMTGPVTIEASNHELVDIAVRTQDDASEWPIRFMTTRFERQSIVEGVPLIDHRSEAPLVFSGNRIAMKRHFPIRVSSRRQPTVVITGNSFHSYEPGEWSAPQLRIAGEATELLAFGNLLEQEGRSMRWDPHEQADGLGVELPPEAAHDPRITGPAWTTVSMPRPHGRELLFRNHVIRVTCPPSPADCAQAIQNAIDDPRLARGGVVYLPRGRYRLARSLVVKTNAPLRVRGDGSDQTVLEWVGPSNSEAAIRVIQGYVTRLAHFRIEAVLPLRAGVSFESLGAEHTWVATGNSAHDVVVDGSRAELRAGFRVLAGRWSPTSGVCPVADGIRSIRAGTGTYERAVEEPVAGQPIECVLDGNNDLASYSFSRVLSYSDAGWSFEHPQGSANLLLHCEFVGAYDPATRPHMEEQAGVTTRRGLASGLFWWIGGRGGSNGGADFLVGAPLTVISDASLRGSQLLIKAGVAPYVIATTIQRSEWAGRVPPFQSWELTRTTRRIIDMAGIAGPLSFLGNRFLGNEQDSWEFLHWAQRSGSFMALGNAFAWNGSATGVRYAVRPVAYSKPPPGGTREVVGQTESTIAGNRYYSEVPLGETFSYAIDVENESPVWPYSW